VIDDVNSEKEAEGVSGALHRESLFKEKICSGKKTVHQRVVRATTTDNAR
jgi:hypothetical protein